MARQFSIQLQGWGHLEVVKSLLRRDSSIGFRTDLKGQTALHMAVKGKNVEIVLELIRPDSSVMNLEDSKGNTALHIASRKGSTQVCSLFCYIIIVIWCCKSQSY